jgi:hypothetical protein
VTLNVTVHDKNGGVNMQKSNRKEFELRELCAEELKAVVGGDVGNGTGKPAAGEGTGLP